MEVVKLNGWEIEIQPGVKDDPESVQRVEDLLRLIDNVSKGKHKERD